MRRIEGKPGAQASFAKSVHLELCRLGAGVGGVESLDGRKAETAPCRRRRFSPRLIQFKRG